MNLLKLLLGSWMVYYAVDPDDAGGGDEPDPEEVDPEDPDPDEPEPEADANEGEEPPRKQSRRDRRIDSLLERTDVLQQQLDAERRAREADQAAARARAAPVEDALPADADELTRWQHGANRAIKESRNASQLALLNAQDASDAVRFEAFMARHPSYEKHRDEVEKRLVEIRGRGQNAPRQDIMAHLLGQLAMKAAGKPAATKAREQAAERVAQARGKPAPSPRSSTAGKERLSEHEKRRERLKNATF